MSTDQREPQHKEPTPAERAIDELQRALDRADEETSMMDKYNVLSHGIFAVKMMLEVEVEDGYREDGSES